MQTAVEWLITRLPVITDDSGRRVLRWRNREGNVQEVVLEYVATRFGPTIVSALAAGQDVADAVASSDCDDGWKDIFSWWSEQGLI